MVGIVQEQHPERARLFMQWKGMDWPVLADPLNLLGVSYVPITLAIDEYGIIRAIHPKADGIEEGFINRSFSAPPELTDRPIPKDMDQLRASAEEGSVEAMRDLADALVMWGSHEELDEAIGVYQGMLKLRPRVGMTHFKLGVAQRARYESPARAAGDFRAAVESWSTALEIDPNNYIWRRRIQQYGPRLGKPYPFYDWVAKARQEILARGETSVELGVEPHGAEIAHPARSLEEPDSSAVEPDPAGRIERDETGFIDIESVVVPPSITPGQAIRVHIVLRPNDDLKTHWNNEGGDLTVWVKPPEGWTASNRVHEVSGPPKAVSQETRTVEFELVCTERTEPGPQTIPAYALYYVCEGASRICLYRRQDIALTVHVQ
jgi:hypothetical protein